MSAFNQLTIKPIVMVLKVLFDGSFNGDLCINMNHHQNAIFLIEKRALHEKDLIGWILGWI
jgi:hypothetical protein